MGKREGGKYRQLIRRKVPSGMPIVSGRTRGPSICYCLSAPMPIATQLPMLYFAPPSQGLQNLTVVHAIYGAARLPASPASTASPVSAASPASPTPGSPASAAYLICPARLLVLIAQPAMLPGLYLSCLSCLPFIYGARCGGIPW